MAATGRTVPWDLHPALTAERLVFLARLIANARRDAIALAEFDLGDDAWSVGCRAYSFSRRRVIRAAEGGEHPWLGILDESQSFVFLVDGVPVRFFRGPADDPADRAVRRMAAEAEQLSLAFGAGADTDGVVFRLAIETAEKGRVERIVFLALRDDRVECVWAVPFEPRLVASTEGVAPGQQMSLIAPELGPANEPRPPARSRRAARG